MDNTVRFELDIKKDASQNYEVSYLELLQKQVDPNHNEEDSQMEPFSATDTEEQKKMEAIAQTFENKYGPLITVKKNDGKKRVRIQDLVDPGDGYDCQDPFIDDTEADNIALAPNVNTKRGGFFINAKQLTKIVDENAVFEPPPKKLKSEKNSLKFTPPKKNKSKQLLDKAVRCLSTPKVKSNNNSTLNLESTFDMVLSKTDNESFSSPVSTAQTNDKENAHSKIEISLTNDSYCTGGSLSELNDTSLNTSKPIEPPVMPDHVPEEIKILVDRLKTIANGVTKGGKRFFTAVVDQDLIKLDSLLNSPNVSKPIRRGVYKFLEFYTPAKRTALIRRFRILREEKETKRLDPLVTKLKNIIVASMPSLLERHAQETESHKLRLTTWQEEVLKMESISKEPVNQESTTGNEVAKSTVVSNTPKKLHKPVAPRRNFHWNDEARSVYAEIITCKLEFFYANNIKITEEEYIKKYLQTSLFRLWPEGWVTIHALWKMSQNAYEKFKFNLLTGNKHPEPFPAAAKTSTPLASANGTRDTSKSQKTSNMSVDSIERSRCSKDSPRVENLSNQSISCISTINSSNASKIESPTPISTLSNSVKIETPVIATERHHTSSTDGALTQTRLDQILKDVIKECASNRSSNKIRSPMLKRDELIKTHSPKHITIQTSPVVNQKIRPITLVTTSNVVKTNPDLPKMSKSSPDFQSLSKHLSEMPRISKIFPDAPQIAKPYPDESKMSKNFPDTQKISKSYPEAPKLARPFPDVPKIAKSSVNVAAVLNIVSTSSSSKPTTVGALLANKSHSLIASSSNPASMKSTTTMLSSSHDLIHTKKMKPEIVPLRNTITLHQPQQMSKQAVITHHYSPQKPKQTIIKHSYEPADSAVHPQIYCDQKKTSASISSDSQLKYKLNQTAISQNQFRPTSVVQSAEISASTPKTAISLPSMSEISSILYQSACTERQKTFLLTSQGSNSQTSNFVPNMNSLPQSHHDLYKQNIGQTVINATSSPSTPITSLNLASVFSIDQNGLSLNSSTSQLHNKSHLINNQRVSSQITPPGQQHMQSVHLSPQNIGTSSSHFTSPNRSEYSDCWRQQQQQYIQAQQRQYLNTSGQTTPTSLNSLNDLQQSSPPNSMLYMTPQQQLAASPPLPSYMQYPSNILSRYTPTSTQGNNVPYQPFK